MGGEILARDAAPLASLAWPFILRNYRKSKRYDAVSSVLRGTKVVYRKFPSARLSYPTITYSQVKP